jgi:hypothetical protein
MKALTWMLVVAISGISPAPSAAKSNDVFVSHYEPLQRLSIHSSSNIAERGAQQIQAAAPIELAFDALGRSFELELEPNSGLLSMASRGALADGVGIYRGQLAGNPDSWARIVVVDGMPRGLIWDGSEMFAVEAPGDSQLQISAPVIYRLADALIVPGSMSCGSSPISGSGAVAYNKLIGELDAAVAQAAGAISEITMGAIGDSLFTNDRGGDIDAAAAITTRLNNVDGIFSEQVGVHINVQLIETFSDPLTDPLTDQRDSSELLDELSGYRSITPAQNSLGLTHLFTGRDLLTTTVGIAWSGTLCESFHGAGLSESRRDATFDSLIAAHEIGHNFGAPHDGQPGACESVPEDFIMAPRLNQSQQFSDCSISIMQATAAAKSCVVALPAVDMGIALSGQISTLLLGANTDLVYDVRNNGTLLATNVVADFVLPVNLTLDSVVASSGDCNSGAGGSVNCSLGDVAELGSRTVTITTTPTSVGVATLSASVSADSDGRPENNQEVLQLTIDPAVDLVVNDFSTLSVQVQQSTTVNAVLENRSSLDATGITLGISLNDELQANSASWSIGSCTVTAHQIDCQASSFAAQSSSTLSVGITGLATGSKGYTFTLSSNEVDNDVANNSATGSIRVTSASGDDEGSGAAGPLFLCLLTLIAVLRRRRA